MVFDPKNITIQDVRSRFQNFEDPPVTDSVITDSLVVALSMWGGECLDDDSAESSFLYLVAHFIVKNISGQQNTAEASDGYIGNRHLSSFTVGSVGEVYTQQLGIKDSIILAGLSTTAYGSTYLMMTEQCRFSNKFGVVRGGGYA